MDQLKQSLSFPFMKTGNVVPLYVPQVITVDLESRLREFLGKLNSFQVRTFQTKPQRAKISRRLVYGLGEVHKHLELGHLKAIFVAKDVDEATVTNEIWCQLHLEAQRQDLPVIYGLSRKEISVVTTKNPKTRIAVVGILSAEGALDIFKDLASTAAELGKQWEDHYIQLTKENFKTLSSAYSLPWLAAAFGHTAVYSNTSNSSINICTGDTALHIACARGHVNLVKHIIEGEPELLKISNYSQQLPIHLAALFKRKHIIALLQASQNR